MFVCVMLIVTLIRLVHTPLVCENKIMVINSIAENRCGRPMDVCVSVSVAPGKDCSIPTLRLTHSYITRHSVKFKGMGCIISHAVVFSWNGQIRD